MKKIIIVNNNMKVGGVQKSLYNLLWSVHEQYDITLYLFSKTGEYAETLPKDVEVIECTSLFRFLGISQGECAGLVQIATRGALALLVKSFGRRAAIRVMSLTQKRLDEEFDIAVSFLQNGDPHSFYGGVNEFVLSKIAAKKKVAFLHCDYGNCGADTPVNNQLYMDFDRIAACSEGCRKAFLDAVPSLKERCMTVRNFHRYEEVEELSLQEPVVYPADPVNVVIVGRLAHEKAVDRAIQAVHYVKRHEISIMLHVVGDGRMMERLKQLTAELELTEQVCFYGEQANPYRFMRNADLLLITSYHEAAPMVIDEARCIGIPVLSVQTTSSQEMIQTYNSGWICDNTQEALNRCLLDVVRDRNSIEERKKVLRAKKADNSAAFAQLGAVFEG